MLDSATVKERAFSGTIWDTPEERDEALELLKDAKSEENATET